LGRYAFQYCTALENIVIPGSVTMMEGAAFLGCTSLVDVTITNGTTYFEPSVFNGCTALESIVIPASVTQIDSWAFKDCTSLTSILFECSEEEFYHLAIDPEYAYLSNATEYYYSETKPTHVGNYWHYVDGVATKWPEYYSEGLSYSNNDDGTCSVGIGTCTDINVIIPAISPDGYMVTGVSLSSCDSIVSAIIPEGVIDVYFQYCASLESIIIPASVTSIDRWAFAYCTSLTSVTFLGNNTIIEQQAFEYCRSLKHFIVPDCNTVISYAAFLSCEALESIVIPKNVTKVEQWAFEFCDALEYVYYTGTEEEWNNIYIDYQNYGLNSVEVIYYSENAPTQRGKFWHYVDGVPTVWPPYVIPDSVGLEYTDNGDGTCYVSGIGTCTDTIIKIPAISPDGYTVTGIGWRAFDTDYGYDNFDVCNAITYIVVPKTVIEISGNIIWEYGSFTRLYYLGTAEEWANVIIDEYGNEEINANTVYFYSEMCPAESGNLWHYDVVPTPWTGIGLEYTSNDDGTCYVSGIGNCSETDLVIPEVSPDGDTVIAIGYEAFYNCDSLVSVYIPDTVTDIQEYAFANCYSLVSARLPECITYIAKSTFEGCSSLETIKIPNSVTEIGENAFYHCTLFTIEIPLSVTSIASGAFTDCSAANPDVYYHGSEWDWQQIQIGENNDYFTNATIYYYYNIE
ncbi:MAG: leucine-rich repeat domain-containing protein, partial [Clostridia bacterium]|nr:leucine-rich repeat domain-containing protein [Clostridia bacterium]